MKQLLVIMLAFLMMNNISAQVIVNGKVLNKENNETLAGVSVIVKGADGKIKKFTTTKKDGDFSMTTDQIEGCRLEISLMGFTKQSISLDSVLSPLTILMEPGTTVLKEIAVKADKIKEQGDTITYRVNAFAQAQDRSIGDVLQRMPGINVDKSGKIQYQGTDINKFYIEGSDLLGGKYGLATNGINHDDVGAVEVMENHQPLQVLSGIAFSDKAALNLKLKNKAKIKWSFHGNAGGGYSWQPKSGIWNGELFTMAVKPSFQSIITIKSNNSGDDISRYIYNYFTTRRGTDLKKYINVSLPGVPNLNLKRTLFNRSALFSSNFLKKFHNTEFKSQIDYFFNNISSDAKSITSYFLNDGKRVVSENRNGTERTHSVAAKFIYEINQKTSFINNTLSSNIDWNNLQLNVSGSIINSQKASFPDYYIGNDFKMIHRINGKHLVTIKSVNEWESLPQNLAVRMENESGGISQQNIFNHAFYTNESMAYAFSLKDVTISFEGGLKGFFRYLKTDLTGIDNNFQLPNFSEEMTNVVNTNYLTFYMAPKFEYWIKKVNLSLNTPISFAHYSFDKALANRNEFYFSPSLSMNWKPSGRFQMNLNGGIGSNPMNLSLINPGYVMTNYRSFQKGIDNFYISSSGNLSANISYKHTRYGVFANGYAMKSWLEMPYTLSQQLYGDYVVYYYSPAKSNSKMFTANGNVGKTLDFINGGFNLRGSFTHRKSTLLSEGTNVNSVGTSWSCGLSISGAPVRWIGVEYKLNYSSSQLVLNGSGASWLGSTENEVLINIVPNRKWEWHIMGEHYRTELTADNFKNMLLLDTKIIFKMSKRIELTTSLLNIFNKKTYSYTTYNDLSSYESIRKLRGREIMIAISLRK